MSFNYAEMAATAAELIEEFGMPMIVRRSSGGSSYDPIEGETIPGVGVDADVFGILLEIDSAYSDKVGGQNIQAGDQVVLLRPGFAPVNSDILIIEGLSWAIVNVNKVSPAGTDLMYEVQVRP